MEQRHRVYPACADQLRLFTSEVRQRWDSGALRAIHQLAFARANTSLDPDHALIQRVRDAADACCMRFDIAPDGLALIESMSAEREAIYSAIKRECGHQRMQTLLELLEQMAEL